MVKCRIMLWRLSVDVVGRVRVRFRYMVKLRVNVRVRVSIRAVSYTHLTLPTKRIV